MSYILIQLYRGRKEEIGKLCEYFTIHKILSNAIKRQEREGKFHLVEGKSCYRKDHYWHRSFLFRKLLTPEVTLFSEDFTLSNPVLFCLLVPKTFLGLKCYSDLAHQCEKPHFNCKIFQDN